MNVLVIDFLSVLANNLQGTCMLLCELSLCIFIVWLILKDNNTNYISNLSEDEEERIIESYKPEDLVEDDFGCQFPLNPLIVQGKLGVCINGFLDFGTHNYLGLAGNSKIESQVLECINTYGVGACGPRAFYGTTLEHLKLESLLANLLKVESSIVYSYGFATLNSAIPVYAKKNDIIFVDEKRNMAIQKGLELSKSKIQYFRHNDVKDLERILANQRKLDLLNKRKARRSRRFLVVEGIYVNTGNICHLPKLLELCKKYKVRVFVDESVSFGTIGSTGKGVTEYFGISPTDIDLIMGSFEYSLASVGGFCAGSRYVIEQQHISSQGFAFSAALPPLLATAVIGALDNIQNSPTTLQQLSDMCQVMHHRLNNSGTINTLFSVTGDADSPIHVLTLRNQSLISQADSEAIISGILKFAISQKVALTRAVALKEDPVITSGVIRITTHAFNSEDQISCFISVLESACYKVLCNCFT